MSAGSETLRLRKRAEKLGIRHTAGYGVVGGRICEDDTTSLIYGERGHSLTFTESEDGMLFLDEPLTAKEATGVYEAIRRLRDGDNS